MEFIKKYCEMDVNILERVFRLFITKFKSLGIDLSKNFYSASSISIRFYFKNFNLIEKKIPQILDNYIRQSYFGGRCEVFGNQRDGEVVLHYDYSGMYSQCMLEKFPYGK
jgi:hypothetical protein